MILYNVPGRTGANIDLATLARLAEIPNIVGVKEASGNMTQMAEAINAVPESFLVFSGDDAVTLPVIALGGVGVISVASNEIPHEMAAMTRAALNNDWATARSIHRKYLPLMQANFIESNPMPVKAVLAMMGRIEENYRLPLLPMRRDTRSKLQKIATEAGLIAKTGCLRLRKRRSFIFMKIGRRGRTRSCCIAGRADNATMAKAVRRGMTPIMRAGMVHMQRWLRAAMTRPWYDWNIDSQRVQVRLGKALFDCVCESFQLIA